MENMIGSILEAIKMKQMNISGFLLLLGTIAHNSEAKKVKDCAYLGDNIPLNIIERLKSIHRRVR
ncbi:MAG: hypothetical protein ABIJ27_07730 [Candidatus Omnitrophota bacterium]